MKIEKLLASPNVETELLYALTIAAPELITLVKAARNFREQRRKSAWGDQELVDKANRISAVLDLLSKHEYWREE